MIRLNSDVKFSYKCIKGSVELRKKIVNDLNEKIFAEISPKINKNSLRVSNIKDIYKFILPEQKNIDILNLTPKEFKISTIFEVGKE